jgi:AcrR family transcriptional regulator
LVVTRKYELKRRAERQEQTRRRIVEAAIELHGTKGPARTTISDIARLAGVERHTFYRHFPDDRSLGLACSGLHMERNPPPDADSWLTIPNPEERLRHGLTELYAWYEQNQGMFGNVLRDAEVDPLTGEMFALRAGDAMARIRAALADGLPASARAQAALDLALDFYAWRRLSRSGLAPEEAAETMAAALRCQ